MIKQWLKADVVEGDEGGKGPTAGQRQLRRTPPGGAISPPLVNLCLHLLDPIWEHSGMDERSRARKVWPANDWVLCCASAVRAPLKVLRQVLERLNLSLNETQTQILDTAEVPFDVLGFGYPMRYNRKSGKPFPHVDPSQCSIQRIRDCSKELTDRRRIPVPLPRMVGELNLTLRGWSNYIP